MAFITKLEVIIIYNLFIFNNNKKKIYNYLDVNKFYFLQYLLSENITTKYRGQLEDTKNFEKKNDNCVEPWNNKAERETRK